MIIKIPENLSVILMLELEAQISLPSPPGLVLIGWLTDWQTDVISSGKAT